LRIFRVFFADFIKKYTKNTKNITLRYLLIVVVIKYSSLKSKMVETGSGSGPKPAVYLYYWT